jgi:hypothetical protein
MSDSAIAAIALYRNDVVSSLRLYFSNSSPSFKERFLGYSPAEVIGELKSESRRVIEGPHWRS